MFFILFRLFPVQYRPLMRAVVGVAIMAIGMFVMTRVLLVIGGGFIVWAIVSWIMQRSSGQAVNRNAGTR